MVYCTSVQFAGSGDEIQLTPAYFHLPGGDRLPCSGAGDMTGTKRSRTPPDLRPPEGSCGLGLAGAAAGPGLEAVGAGRTTRRRGSCYSYPWQRSYPAPQDGGRVQISRRKHDTQFNLANVIFIILHTLIATQSILSTLFFLRFVLSLV